ncbi:MAG: FHA domain-containing protein [Deltaproteobacteria bacterium]|nr:FHA domain-containing protein [Deltaproteobacteria bacterium]
MSLTSKLLEILVCPQCKGRLAQVEGGQGLLCDACQLKYPVKEGIPVMLAEEAVDMRASARAAGEAAPREAAPQPRTFQRQVAFRVLSGPDEGMDFTLESGMCRALGRAVGDPAKTTILNVDWALSLDEETKGLVLQYISQQFRKPAAAVGAKQDQLGAFQRGPDVIFKDQALSRLHAMVFFDEIGIGILDLVSKNGTYVNGKEVESCLLKKGDAIELGESKIVFEG